MAEMRLTVKTVVSNSACSVGLGIDEEAWENLTWAQEQIIIEEALIKLITVEVAP